MTRIEWVRAADGSQGFTLNPIRFRNLETGKVGHYCEKISAGCKNCFASTMQKPYLSGLEFAAENRDKGELLFDAAVLQTPLKRKKPTAYFWSDMTDLFGSWVPDEWIDCCFAMMALTPQHRHFVLTKRAERLEEYSTSDATIGSVLAPLVEALDGVGRLEATHEEDGLSGLRLANVLLGVSVENREQKRRIDALKRTPAALRFLSLEPLLEDLGALDLTGIDWVIVGGESGPGARPMHPDWVRSIRRQCVEAKVPFFFKQWGEFAPWREGLRDTSHGKLPTCERVNLGIAMGEPALMYRVGKKAAGRLLDGRGWNEMPEVPHA